MFLLSFFAAYMLVDTYQITLHPSPNARTQNDYERENYLVSFDTRTHIPARVP